MKKSILVCVLVLLPVASVVRGATFDVTTIAELETALDTAESNAENDTINISAGTYTLTAPLTYTSSDSPVENYSLTIQSAGGNVILDGGYSYQILKITTWVGGEDTSDGDITIKGITIQNGDVDGASDLGGGLNLRAEADIVIEDTKFIDNDAEGFYQDPSAGGAFIKAESGGSVTLTGNTFSGNSADIIGGGLYIYSSVVTLTNNIFTDNDVSVSGGGAYIKSLPFVPASITVTNNTFSDNESTNGVGSFGGGLYVLLWNDGDTANIYNNIIWGNTAGSGGTGGDIYVDADGDDNLTGATVNLYNNDYTDFDYNDGDNLTQSDNIDQDPLLTHNLRIQVGSPCINTGLDAAPSAPAADIDGQARVSPIDIGVDEYVASSDISVLPNPVAFGNVTLNTPSTKTVTFSNIGVLSLAITNIQISGTDASLFTLDVNGGSNPCGSTSPTIAAGGNGTVTITFTPTTDGSKTASLDITSNDPDEPTANISLTGIGALVAVADIDVTDAIAPNDDLEMDFGSISTGSSSSAKTVTLANTGTATLTVSSIAVSGVDASNFTLDVNGGSNPCGSTSPTIAAGGNGTVTITFTPTTDGSKTASLDITSSDADEDVVNVSLTGTGSAAAVSDIDVTDAIVPADDLLMGFGSIQVGTSSLAKTVTISNGGSAALVVSSITVSGVDASDFTLDVNGGSSPVGSTSPTIAAGGSGTVTITFSPAAAGIKSASLGIASNDTDEATVNVTLGGTGIAAAVSDIDVTDDVAPTDDLQMNFGSLTAGSSSSATTVTITNGGSAALAVSNIAVSGADASDFTLDVNGGANPVGSTNPTIAAGGSGTVTITFSPAAAGIKSASLNITSDDPDEGTVSISLSGTGTAAAGGGGGICFISTAACDRN